MGKKWGRGYGLGSSASGVENAKYISLVYVVEMVYIQLPSWLGDGDACILITCVIRQTGV
jgi:hypothetical protein